MIIFVVQNQKHNAGRSETLTLVRLYITASDYISWND
jgi:hypothetical protein